MLDPVDRELINLLQDGISVCERPFGAAAVALGIGEQEIVARLGSLLDAGVLTRFGPLFDAERLGGAFTLCAMQVPADRFEEVAAKVNAFDEVAHNYERDHELNMWFVLGADSAQRVAETIDTIERTVGLPVLNLPKLDEFYIGLKLNA